MLKMSAKTSKEAKVMSQMDTSLLLVTSNSAMLAKTAHSVWMHLREVDLKISDLTNPVELGLRNDLRLEKGDVDDLEKKIQRQIQKSTTYVGKFQDQAADLDKLWKSQ